MIFTGYIAQPTVLNHWTTKVYICKCKTMTYCS